MFEADDTIAAISTPAGRSGIGVIRITGPGSFPIAEKLARPRKGRLAPDRRMRLCDAIEPSSSRTVDEVLVVLMPAPKTYTRQDLAEIHAHGGPAVLGRLLDLTLAEGARLAEPGEFTLRAFINGRIDLAQAEAVAALVNAQTEGGAAEAARQLAGGLSAEVIRLRERLIIRLASLEAAIDFPEEELPALDSAAVAADIDAVKRRCEELSASFKTGRILTHGAKVAIVGRPNVGKSSLFNALLKQERALVHERPGTTRDVVEDRLVLSGLPVTLADTAGLNSAGNHAEADPVELAGMNRARRSLDEADAVLAVFDLSGPLGPADREIWESLRGRSVIAAFNKTDIAGSGADQEFAAELEAETWVATSAKTGLGVDLLAEGLGRLIIEAADVSAADSILISRRHADAAAEAAAALGRALAALERGMAPEFAAMDIREAAMALGRIIGRFGDKGTSESVEQDVLEEIFSHFCIGK